MCYFLNHTLADQLLTKLVSLKNPHLGQQLKFHSSWIRYQYIWKNSQIIRRNTLNNSNLCHLVMKIGHVLKEYLVLDYVNVFVGVLDEISRHHFLQLYSREVTYTEAHINMAHEIIPFILAGFRLQRKTPSLPLSCSSGTRPTSPLTTTLGSVSPRSTVSINSFSASGCC